MPDFPSVKVHGMNLAELLIQRRSTRHFDAAAPISPHVLTQLLNTACRAPSGNNAQPWRFMIITEAEWREKLFPIAFQQNQILTASAIIVLLADRNAYEAENLTAIHEAEYQDGCFDEKIRDFLTQAAIGFYQPFTENDMQKSLALDCGLWAMTFMLAAEDAGWQTVPMTGYQSGLLRQTLQIPERYLDIMMIAIGKGTQAGHRTLRLPAGSLAFWNRVPD